MLKCKIPMVHARITLTITLVLMSLAGNAQLADGKCKFLGNVIAGSVPGNYTAYWNQVTPENAGKWGSVEATRDVMNWSQLDLAYNFAQTNGFPFKLHTLVWGQQQPAWIGTLSLQEQREEVEEWISLLAERYPNTAYIDVVNEPFHATPVYDQALGSGWNWVIWSFQKARQYFPNAKLALNDYNIINSNTSTDAYVGLINMLKAENLIDIIGEQGHFLETTDNATLTANLNKLHATGIPIHISEYDVNIADDAQQRDKYMSQFPVLWAHPGVQGITLWGYQQGSIWRTDAYLITSAGMERPAMTWLKNYMTTAPGGSFCLVLGINETSPILSVYPNPSSDGKIILEADASAVSVKVRDAFGRIIETAELAAQQKMPVKLEGSKGVYILEIRRSEEVLYKRVLVH